MIRWIKKKLRKTKVVEDHNEVSAERNSLKDQQSVGEKGIKGFEYRIPSNDEEIRLLKLEHRQVLEERNSLKDQLSQAKMKIAGLENSRAFEVEETMKFLNYLVSDGKKEKDDAGDKEIQRLNLELCKKKLEINEKLNLRDAEIHRLKMIIKSMCSDLEKAFATAKSALPDPHVLPQILEEPGKKPQEEDIIGAVITPVISRDGSHS